MLTPAGQPTWRRGGAPFGVTTSLVNLTPRAPPTGTRRPGPSSVPVSPLVSHQASPPDAPVCLPAVVITPVSWRTGPLPAPLSPTTNGPLNGGPRGYSFRRAAVVGLCSIAP